jgi:beta-lactamase class D
MRSSFLLLLGYLRKFTACLVAVGVVLGTATTGWCEDADLAKLFADRNVEGTMVMCSLDGSARYVHNDRRASTRFVPASTFKILNTLIALDEGVIADDTEILRWDGKDRGVPAWNHDQTLETAFRSSCVWAYQELARRIGTEKYVVHLRRAAYGNAITGPDVTTFWLVGDLKISAVEQIALIEKFYRRTLDFRPSSYKILNRIMALEQTPSYTLWGKTGWALDMKPPQVGWFVGYVVTGNNVWLFAMNMDITTPDQARYRQEIAAEALKIKGVL